jgi:hypothetical protein
MEMTMGRADRRDYVEETYRRRGKKGRIIKTDVRIDGYVKLWHWKQFLGYWTI